MGAASARVETPDAPSPEIKGPIGDLFRSERARAMIVPLLRGVSYDGVIAETYMLLRKKPELLKCTSESILWSVADCLRLKLVFGETAHMVPFNVKVKRVDAETGRETEHWEDRAQCIVGWKGAIELVVRSGAARDVDAQDVYENELVYPDNPAKNFEVRYGSNPDVNHFPRLRRAERGEYVGTYAVARLNQTQKKVLWMPVEEIDGRRKKYSKMYGKGDMPDWYPRKTLILALCNKLPKNGQLEDYLKVMQRDPEIMEIEEIEATVTDTPARPRMLTDGPMQPVYVAQGEPVSATSDEERIEQANRALNMMTNGEMYIDDPRGPDGHKAPF